MVLPNSNLSPNILSLYLRNTWGQAQWRTPAIPALWESKADESQVKDRDHPGQHGETSSLLKKKKKISWTWWWVSVIPATRDAEAGELLEPKRRRL